MVSLHHATPCHVVDGNSIQGQYPEIRHIDIGEKIRSPTIYHPRFDSQVVQVGPLSVRHGVCGKRMHIHFECEGLQIDRCTKEL
jgi:hypothetical protein